MKNEIVELEEIITKSLLKTNNLINERNKIEIEKLDQLKGIAISIIDVLDSFENIENSFIEKGQDKNEDVIKTMKRYQSIQRKLYLILQKNGITKIDFPENRLIQGFCEVLETQPDASKNNDEIISIVRHGYMKGKELIRSAQLIIVKN
ncbi:MAG: co-chaperone GrpE [Bacteroidetes bacterium]|nr:MAG: co-chaperone GrpE [Bacteroidota bacterium]